MGKMEHFDKNDLPFNKVYFFDFFTILDSIHLYIIALWLFYFLYLAFLLPSYLSII